MATQRTAYRGLDSQPEASDRKLMLVYQAGIANVFEVDCFNVAASGRELTYRLYQGDFYGALMYCRGAGRMGAVVRTVHCNMAGNVANQDWTEDLESAPFADKLINLRLN
jgi:hypothetical protein